jgi:hypothetical protein
LARRSTERFANVGVHSPDKILQSGSIGCYGLGKSILPNHDLNFLRPVEGQVRDFGWKLVPENRKQVLLQQSQTGSAARAMTGNAFDVSTTTKAEEN